MTHQRQPPSNHSDLAACLDLQLAEQRERAAKLSGGVSAEVIYSAVERIIADRNAVGAVLDFGAGTGVLSQRLLLQPRFSSVSAIDIMPRPDDLPHQIHWFRHDLNLVVPFESVFDVVIAAEVIEHLENPRFTIRQMAKSLRPGGLLIVSTPNNESWRALLSLVVRGHFVAFSDSCYPAHLTAMVRKDLSRIGKEVGLANHDFRFTDYGSLPGAPQVTWQQISFRLLRGLRFSDNLLFTCTKPI